MGKLPEQVAAAHADEHDIGLVAEPSGCGEDRTKFMRPTKVTRIACEKLSFRLPALSKWIKVGRHWDDGLILAPIGDDADTIFGNVAGRDLFRP